MHIDKIKNERNRKEEQTNRFIKLQIIFIFQQKVIILKIKK